MSDGKNSLYFYMTIGHIGLLLIALVVMRFISVFRDTPGQILGLVGFMFIGIYLRFLEKKMGVSKKVSVVS